MNYGKMRETMLRAAKAMTPRTASDRLRRTMRRYLKGKRFRPSRKAIKRMLGHHERWTAEAYAALNPWSQDWDAYVEHQRNLKAPRDSATGDGVVGGSK
jgi:hypothetical protein